MAESFGFVLSGDKFRSAINFLTPQSSLGLLGDLFELGSFEQQLTEGTDRLEREVFDPIEKQLGFKNDINVTGFILTIVTVYIGYKAAKLLLGGRD